LKIFVFKKKSRLAQLIINFVYESSLSAIRKETEARDRNSIAVRYHAFQKKGSSVLKG